MKKQNKLKFLQSNNLTIYQAQMIRKGLELIRNSISNGNLSKKQLTEIALEQNSLLLACLESLRLIAELDELKRISKADQHDR